MIPGFRITDTEIITKLSGPVSMSLLIPTRTYLQKNPGAPIFMLFGDSHNSSANLCPGDVPNKHRIYKLEFLQTLCNLLRGNEIIDYYTEGGDIGRHSEPIYDEKAGPFCTIWNLSINCNKYKDDAKSPYQVISKIKWQHGDIRFWTLESKQKEIAKQKPVQYYDISNLIHNIIGYDPLYINTPTSSVFASLFIANVEQLKKKSYEIEEYIPATPDKIYHRLVSSQCSLIYYQLSKLTKGKRSFLLEKFEKYVYHIYDTQCQNAGLTRDGLAAVIKQMHYNIHLCFKNLDIGLIKAVHEHNHYNTYSKFTLYIRSIQLDMFTFAKSFSRMPVNPDSHSIMNICYFGDYHIKNIVHFLTNILDGGSYFIGLETGHQDDSSLSTHDINRCLDLSKILTEYRLDEFLAYVRQEYVTQAKK